MTKEEKIAEAWIESQLHIKSQGVPHYNSDGWAKYGGKQNSEWFKTLEEKQWLGYYFYRPKSLKGIENNNGWIKIESETDLPKDKEICHFVTCGDFEDQFVGFIDKIMDEVFFVDKYYVASYDEFNKPILKLNSWIPSQITHYQPVEKPQPPIY